MIIKPYLTQITGVLKISSPQDAEITQARIVSSFIEIERGNLVTPVEQDLLVRLVPVPTAKDVQGVVMAVRNGRETVVIIDEAHTIRDSEVFEEVRLLMNFQLETRFLLTLLLLGQPELKALVDDNKQLSQRIAIRCYLNSLAPVETVAYVRHRLSVAGREGPLFTDGALKAVFEHSGGIPRRINQVCDMSLFTGFGVGARQVDEAVVEDAVNALHGT